MFDAGAPALAEMATDQRKQADPYASDYKLGAKELSFTTPALYTINVYFLVGSGDENWLKIKSC